MKEFAQPSMEFVSLGEESIVASSCGGKNCQNALGYGDLCGGVGGHDDCPNFTSACPNDDAP